MTQVPSSCRWTTWLSQIFSNRVRGGGGGGGGVADFLRNAMVRLLLSAALGGARSSLLFLRLLLLELLAARCLLGDQLALGLDVLGDAARLAAQVAQVIELGAAHDAFTDDLDFPDVRAVEREHALDALVERDLAHGERGVHAGILAGDALAFVDLDALAVAFLHLEVHPERIARLETRHRPFGGDLVHLGLAQRIENVHRTCPFVTSLRLSLRCGGPTNPAAEPA